MQSLSVSELNAQVKSLLEATFIQVSVSGEVANFTKHTSGHLYFTLKDKDSTLKCVMFSGNATKLKFQIQEGMDLILNGAISVYTPRGEYQLRVLNAYPNGVGTLNLAFAQLKAEYEKKGYFDNKKPLPKFPKKVGLITSSTGAVVHDMLSVAQKRWNLVEFTLLNTLVQGEGAKEEIARNLAFADTLGLDCIVLARGGGSMEDLWAFNEPLVIEAIFALKTPVISAIGHEPDIVLSDFVADLRAPTPSAAMEILLPDQNEWLLTLDSAQNALKEKFLKVLQAKQTHLEHLRVLLDKNPVFSKIEFLNFQAKQQESLLWQGIEHQLKLCALKLQSPQLTPKIQQFLEKAQIKLESLRAQLEARNPKSYQKDGYVCALSNGKKIKNLAEIALDSILELQDTSAVIEAKVQKITLSN